MSSVSLPEEVRAACAWVAARARLVRIAEEKIDNYAVGLADAADATPSLEPAAEAEAAAAFAICMNAINFGSGWWPTIRKRPGHSGYATMAAGLRERFDARGPWSAEELVATNAGEVAAVLGQDPDHPLMGRFAAALRDVGAHLVAEHGGRYLGVVEGANSIPDLARALAGWDAFADVSEYEGRDVPFYKRAQLAAADLHRAGVASLPGAERLTAFADNLVPHVLRVDGVLRLHPALTARLEAEELLVHGSPRGGRAARLRGSRRRVARRRGRRAHPGRDRRRPLEPRSQPPLQVDPAAALAQHRLLTPPPDAQKECGVQSAP